MTKREHHKDEPWYEVHPAALTVREDAIDPFVVRFFDERVFGPHRLIYLQGPTDDPVGCDQQVQAAGFARQLAELDAANRNLLLSLQEMTSTGDAEIDSQWRTQLQHQFAENTKRKQAITVELEALARTVRQPAQVRRDLVDQLPQVDLNVLELPGELQRQLFDAFQLEIRYDRHRRQVTIKVAIRAEMIDAIGRTTTDLAGQIPSIPGQRRPTDPEKADRAGAPAPARSAVPMFDVPPGRGEPASANRDPRGLTCSFIQYDLRTRRSSVLQVGPSGTRLARDHRPSWRSIRGGLLLE